MFLFFFPNQEGLLRNHSLLCDVSTVLPDNIGHQCGGNNTRPHALLLRQYWDKMEGDKDKHGERGWGRGLEKQINGKRRSKWAGKKGNTTERRYTAHMKRKREMEFDLMTQFKDIGRNAMANFTSAVKNDLVCASAGVCIYTSRRSARMCVCMPVQIYRDKGEHAYVLFRAPARRPVLHVVLTCHLSQTIRQNSSALLSHTNKSMLLGVKSAWLIRELSKTWHQWKEPSRWKRRSKRLEAALREKETQRGDFAPGKLILFCRVTADSLFMES